MYGRKHEDHIFRNGYKDTYRYRKNIAVPFENHRRHLWRPDVFLAKFRLFLRLEKIPTELRRQRQNNEIIYLCTVHPSYRVIVYGGGENNNEQLAVRIDSHTGTDSTVLALVISRTIPSSVGRRLFSDWIILPCPVPRGFVMNTDTAVWRRQGTTVHRNNRRHIRTGS